MADLKQIDEYKASIQEQLNNEFDYFPLKEFNNAGVIPNENDPGLKLAADAELFEIEQQVMQQQPDEKHTPKVWTCTINMIVIVQRTVTTTMFIP